MFDLIVVDDDQDTISLILGHLKNYFKSPATYTSFEGMASALSDQTLVSKDAFFVLDCTTDDGSLCSFIHNHDFFAKNVDHLENATIVIHTGHNSAHGEIEAFVKNGYFKSHFCEKSASMNALRQKIIAIKNK